MKTVFIRSPPFRAGIYDFVTRFGNQGSNYEVTTTPLAAMNTLLCMDEKVIQLRPNYTSLFGLIISPQRNAGMLLY
jgi:hypothetical protein